MRGTLLVLAAVAACGSSGEPSSVSRSLPQRCSRPMQITGVLHTTAADVLLDGASVQPFASARWDVDAAESGPMVELALAVTKDGCRLWLLFSRVTEDTGLHRARFRAESTCPGFWNATEGDYHRERTYPGNSAPRWPEGMPTQIAGGNEVGKCVEALSLRFPGMAYTLVTGEVTPRLLHVDLGDVVISGDLFVAADLGNAPTYEVPASCVGGSHDGGDGWCVPLGTCSPGHPIDAQGLCSPFPHL